MRIQINNLTVAHWPSLLFRQLAEIFSPPVKVVLVRHAHMTTYPDWPLMVVANWLEMGHLFAAQSNCN